MPAEAMPRLFEKFYRVRQRGGPSRRGLGIGLSVVKGMVEAMGGHVSAGRSQLGGLAVTLDLPAASGPPEEPPLVKADHHPAGAALLIVEDDAATRGT